MFVLSLDPSQRSNSTSLHYVTPRHWRRTFIGTSHAMF